MALNSHIQNPSAWQSAIDRFAETTLFDVGDIFIEGCDAREMCWSDVRGLPIGRFGRATGFVYFATIGMERPTHVKVGFTAGDPWKRVAALQTGCPFPLALVHVIPGNPELETALHYSLHEDRVSGEWFELTARARVMIRSYWDERL